MAGPALRHRRHARWAQLIHDLCHQVCGLSVGRHVSVPADAEGAALGAATPYASTTIVAIAASLLVLVRACLARLRAVRLLLLLPLLSGQITAEILPVRLALLAGLLLIGIRAEAIALVLRSVFHVLLRCSHLLPSHSDPHRVTQPCPIGPSMNKRHEQVASSKRVQCSSSRRWT